MRPGFYGNQIETFFVDSFGGFWLVGVFGDDGARVDRLEDLPRDASPIHNSIVEEALWQRVISDARIVWRQKRQRASRRDTLGAARELCAEAAVRFWDLVGEDHKG